MQINNNKANKAKEIKLGTVPKSQILFEESFKNFSEKISGNNVKQLDTIFTKEGTSTMIQEDCSRAYDFFKQSIEYDTIQENSFTMNDHEKKKKIKLFLENTYLTILYSEIFEASNHSKLSFKQEMLFENTMDVHSSIVNLVTEDIKFNDVSVSLMEEGAFLHNMKRALNPLNLPRFLADVGVSSVGMVGMLVLGVIKDRKAKSFMGILKGAVMSSSDLFKMENPGNSFEHSRKSIFEFDRINSNPEIKKIFQKLVKSEASYKDAPVLVDTIFSQCLNTHHLMFDNLDLSAEEKRTLKDQNYNPRDGGTVLNVAHQIIKQTTGRNNPNKSAVLSYRKCLAGSLADVYKYLMIGVFAQDENRQKISGLLTKSAFDSNPETLVRFMKTEKASDEMNTKAAILVQLRVAYDDLIEDLMKGALDIDKESGNFFKQKLKEADSEISDYLLKTKGTRNKDDDSYSENDEDENKNFLATGKKRSLLGMGNS